MDDFKKARAKYLGPGGVHCPCCNPFYKNKADKRKLNKLARQKMKRGFRGLMD